MRYYVMFQANILAMFLHKEDAKEYERMKRDYALEQNPHLPCGDQDYLSESFYTIEKLWAVKDEDASIYDIPPSRAYNCHATAKEKASIRKGHEIVECWDYEGTLCEMPDPNNQLMDAYPDV